MSTKTSSEDRNPNDTGGSTRSDYRTLDLSNLVGPIWKRRRFVIGTAFAGLIMAGIVSMLLHPKYDATARLRPPTPRESAMMTFLPTLSPADAYLALLDSRTVADDVIEHQHLKDYFRLSRPSLLRRSLEEMSNIRVGKDQLITVTVRASEPETALRIANEYVDALYRLSHSISLAEAEHRWEYFEAPLEQEKNKLAEAEESLKRAQQSTGIVMPEVQIRLGVTALGQLKQNIAEREVQLAALRTGGTESNPRVIALRSEISSLNSQVARMEAETGGGGAAKTNLPELTLLVERKTREVKYHETLFGILSRQYENARVDQSYTQQIEVVDRPVIPDEKAWPQRKMLMILGFCVGAMLGLLFVSIRAAQWPHQLRGVLSRMDARVDGEVANH